MIDLRDVQMRQPWHLELHGEGLKQQIFFDRSDLEQGLAQTTAFRLLNVQGFEQLRFGQSEFLLEDRPE
jgi:hypothetical protein